MPRSLIALVLLISACAPTSTATTRSSAGVQANAPDTTSVVSPAEQASATTVTPEAVESSTPDGDPLDSNSIAFVAALEEAMIGTSFEGAVLSSPELFIATAEVICVRLDNGDDIDQILVDYIDGLSNTDGDGDTVGENEAAMVAGGVLGASIELFCPQHRTLIEDE